MDKRKKWQKILAKRKEGQEKGELGVSFTPFVCNRSGRGMGAKPEAPVENISFEKRKRGKNEGGNSGDHEGARKKVGDFSPVWEGDSWGGGGL